MYTTFFPFSIVFRAANSATRVFPLAVGAAKTRLSPSRIPAFIAFFWTGFNSEIPDFERTWETIGFIVIK